MGDRDFSDEQKRYLEGFVSGVQASRAAAGLKPLAGVGGASRARRPRRRPSQGDGALRGAGPQALAPRRRSSATSIPSTPMRA